MSDKHRSAHAKTQGESGGAPAAANSLVKMYRLDTDHPHPPHCFGQVGAAQPLA